MFKNIFRLSGILFMLILLTTSCMMMHPMGTGMDMSKGHQMDTYTDPVCGMNVNADSAYAFSYNKMIYYFDTGECLKTFQKNPQQFVHSEMKMHDENTKMDMSDGLIWGGVAMGALMIAMMLILITGGR
ncbi:MAG TPA: YHS domain-containing protein [Cyclobacteriaceae bacterium]|nr:YHS domain-containing protein [Cyclobacteriaceae bacterium]